MRTADGMRGRGRAGGAARLASLLADVARGLTLGVRAVVVDEARPHLPGTSTPMCAAGTCRAAASSPGETLPRGARRASSSEEGNIELTEPPVLHGVFFNPRWSRRDHVACFVVQSFHQSAPPAPNGAIAAARFVALVELPGDTSAGSRARLAEVLLGAPVSEKW